MDPAEVKAMRKAMANYLRTRTLLLQGYTIPSPGLFATSGSPMPGSSFMPSDTPERRWQDSNPQQKNRCRSQAFS
ncbi:hypothetical protein PoB_007266400 [Plakobranchus ocellatus]|uniref:Uncharacterized protein n=1 Tax=Plakobranchus ocellatus TaxID=259542 RepID=A0AAV4DPQ3_9GAST|nr:hypothetical protein PoB_007266400 [Plakobranchus ocellatus]